MEKHEAKILKVHQIDFQLRRLLLRKQTIFKDYLEDKLLIEMQIKNYTKTEKENQSEAYNNENNTNDYNILIRSSTSSENSFANFDCVRSENDSYKFANNDLSVNYIPSVNQACTKEIGREVNQKLSDRKKIKSRRKIKNVENENSHNKNLFKIYFTDDNNPTLSLNHDDIECMNNSNISNKISKDSYKCEDDSDSFEFFHPKNALNKNSSLYEDKKAKKKEYNIFIKSLDELEQLKKFFKKGKKTLYLLLKFSIIRRVKYTSLYNIKVNNFEKCLSKQGMEFEVLIKEIKHFVSKHGLKEDDFLFHDNDIPFYIFANRIYQSILRALKRKEKHEVLNNINA